MTWPPFLLTIDAPLDTASSIRSLIYWGLDGSGKGVKKESSSHGIPNFKLSTAFANFMLNLSTIDSWTYKTLSAVHLCPLYERQPEIHSWIVKSRSASGNIIPGFFASSPKTSLSLFLLGCWSWRATADELWPISASTSTKPVFIIGGHIFLPLPNKILTTPGGKHSLKAFNRGAIKRTPCFAGLKIVVLPIKIAGINKQKVSLSG